jgi:hypothetical protein
MSSAGGCPSWQAMVSVGTSIVPPGPCPPPADTPGASSAVTTPQVTASIHDFAVSLALLTSPERREPITERGTAGLIGMTRPWDNARCHAAGRMASLQVKAVSDDTETGNLHPLLLLL